MNTGITRRLDRLEAAALGKAGIYLFREAGQTEAEALAARFGTPTPPPGMTVTFFQWQQPTSPAARFEETSHV